MNKNTFFFAFIFIFLVIDLYTIQQRPIEIDLPTAISKSDEEKYNDKLIKELLDKIDQKSYNKIYNTIDTNDFTELDNLITRKEININAIDENVYGVFVTPLCSTYEDLGILLQSSNTWLTHKFSNLIKTINDEHIIPFQENTENKDSNDIKRLSKFLIHNIVNTIFLESQKPENIKIAEQQLSNKSGKIKKQTNSLIAFIELLIENGADKDLALKCLKESLFKQILNSSHNAKSFRSEIIKSILTFSLVYIIKVDEEIEQEPEKESISPEKNSPLIPPLKRKRDCEASSKKRMKNKK